MAQSVHYTQVQYDSDAYHQMVAVRSQQLRTPYGWTFSAEELEQDALDRHLAAVDAQGKVIATVVLKPLSDKQIRIRQVAVEASHQRLGYGRGLIRYAENLACSWGYACVVLYAREENIAYYEQIGYSRADGWFEDRGVRFMRLDKPLSGSSAR